MNPAMDDALRQVEEYVLRANALMTILRTLRNSAVHINRVPTELLAEIFWHATPPSSDRRTDIVQLNCVTHVCMHWRTVALDAARLWGALWIARQSDVDASDDEPPSRIEEYLRRSKSHPLDVTIKARTNLRATGVDSCIEVLRPHQHRMRELHVITHHYDIMQSVLSSHLAATRLEELRLESGDPRLALGTLQPQGLFGGHSPPLHSIHLSSVSVSLNDECHILRNLQHLILLGQRIPITEMDTLFDILDHCPDLKTLKLHSHPALPRLPAPQPPAHTDRDVLLPSLQVVDIEWQQPMVAGWLLEHLCLPETANVTVYLPHPEYMSNRAAIRTGLSSMRTLWIPPTSYIDSDHRMILSGFTDSIESLFETEFSRPTGPALSISVEWHMELEEEAPDPLIRFIQTKDASQFSAVHTLIIDHGLYQDFHQPDHWASLFEVVPGLRTLHLRGVNKSLSSSFAALCASDIAHGQSAISVRPRLAALQTLEIKVMWGEWELEEDTRAALTRAVRLMSMDGALQTLRLAVSSGRVHEVLDVELLRQFCTVEITVVDSGRD
ncbi:uncharacterized protein C8Q71DRAFT_733615 [Rhodofomes roseus]|uniref:F-box domain-containing protein n=1 Tax=Rhodofomes roseus TaxID=34475 RepID=A0ABQ8KVP0_9APHY|nr:uncharacterized protein C8Q71DRAFT_733615 [Rhodofomes roseus]KAH9842604.1 hypothetical protein C8Q71DRAFT_733615 [Rhodofomes roseus]